MFTVIVREVLPYTKDAWYVPRTVKIGYEISFNRYFYKPSGDAVIEGYSGGHLGVGT